VLDFGAMRLRFCRRDNHERPKWILSLLLAVAGASGLPLFGSETNSDESLRYLNLPEDFEQNIEARLLIDHYQAVSYASEEELGATPFQPLMKRSGERRGTIRTLRDQWDPSSLREMQSLPDQFHPLRGYRAPILAQAAGAWPAALSEAASTQQVAAARIVSRRLAFDGLLATMVSVIEALGPASFLTNDAAAVGQLRAVGFPTDWLHCFRLETGGKRVETAADWARLAAAGLMNHETVENLGARFGSARFEFHPSAAGFEVATESGEYPLRRLRVQVGGGYNEGVIPGSSLDFLGHLVEALPEADLLVSIQDEYLEDFRRMASHSWPLRRANQLTLVSEPLKVSAWAQDNGKPGRIKSGTTNRAALLVPRYASIDEGVSVFQPGESFLMRGVKTAGLEVEQSLLLFQGGNVLAVREPSSGRRVLLIGESELHRNTALGLTMDEVLEAFRVEFGVDQCVVLPVGSFHLDYDVSVRSQNGRVVAFVSDPWKAVEIILKLGLDALEHGEILSSADARAAREYLATGRKGMLGELLWKSLARFQNPDGKYKKRLAQCFATDPVDSASANLQCFLFALDFLDEGETPANQNHERRDYLQATHRLKTNLNCQRLLLEAQGWEVAIIPSLPDVRCSISYINGVHGSACYLMPAYGGFYSELDRVAAAAFEKRLPEGVRVIPLLCTDSQRNHGAVHCMVSVSPRMEDWQ